MNYVIIYISIWLIFFIKAIMRSARKFSMSIINVKGKLIIYPVFEKQDFWIGAYFKNNDARWKVIYLFGFPFLGYKILIRRGE